MDLDGTIRVGHVVPNAAVAADHSRISAWSLNRFSAKALRVFAFFALVWASYWLISNFFLQSVRITGVSMQPTLRNTQHCFLNRWVYYARAPQRGDIVVLRDPSDKGLAVKRIVATSGDHLAVSAGGEVFLNGQKLREPYLPAGTVTYPGPQAREQEFFCGEEEFVVLGDNRGNSADSRNYGAISRRDILGLVIP